MISLIDGAIQQGFVFGIATLGVMLALRQLRYPDLTADGSFQIGGTALGAAVAHGVPWPLALALSIVAGALAGAITASINRYAGVSRLLSGILTSMICYSAGFWLLSGRPNISLGEHPTPYTLASSLDARMPWSGLGLYLGELAVSAAFFTATTICVAVLLRSQWGLVFRAAGPSEDVVTRFGRSPARYRLGGLMLANACIGLAGGLAAARQGFADVNSGPGVIVIFIASLVLGEELIGRIRPGAQSSTGWGLLAPLAGCVAYYGLFLSILRASIAGWLPITIRPTDLKMLSALMIVGVVFLRSRNAGVNHEEQLPL